METNYFIYMYSIKPTLQSGTERPLVMNWVLLSFEHVSPVICKVTQISNGAKVSSEILHAVLISILFVLSGALQ